MAVVAVQKRHLKQITRRSDSTICRLSKPEDLMSFIWTRCTQSRMLSWDERANRRVHVVQDAHKPPLHRSDCPVATYTSDRTTH